MRTARRVLHVVARAGGGALVAVSGGGCSRAPTVVANTPPVPVTTAALKTEFQHAFMIGTALNSAQFSGTDLLGDSIVTAQFNTVSPENALKWQSVHPSPGVYTFSDADQYVAFAQAHHMFIVGHNLVWHNQTPGWVFQDANGAPASRDTLIARMRDHIMTVVGRYAGRINGWDVVNEALNDDGTLRQSPWYTIIGPDYLTLAYQFAHEADPSAQLYYNDYSLENAPKRNGAIALIRGLLAQGIPITAVGIQGHDKLDWPSAALEDSTISAFAAVGIKVNISELDIDVLPAAVSGNNADIRRRAVASTANDPFTGGLPDSVQAQLTRQYASLFQVFLNHRSEMQRVTFWGVTDADSWLNNWPVPGRTNYPLLFDRQGHPKPAFDAVVREARETLSQN